MTGVQTCALPIFKDRFGTSSDTLLRDSLGIAQGLLEEVEIGYESVIRNDPVAIYDPT